MDNLHAQRLYRTRGFEQVGVRRGYYQPSGADALVMRRDLADELARPGAAGDAAEDAAEGSAGKAAGATERGAL